MKNLAKISFKTLRVVFGVFMIFIYFGMAALMYFNFFEWTASYTWFRYLLAVVFAPGPWLVRGVSGTCQRHFRLPGVV